MQTGEVYRAGESAHQKRGAKTEDDARFTASGTAVEPGLEAPTEAGRGGDISSSRLRRAADRGGRRIRSPLRRAGRYPLRSPAGPRSPGWLLSKRRARGL